MATPRKGASARTKKPLRRRSGEGSFCITATGGVRYRCAIGATAAGAAIRKDFYGRDKEEAIAKAEAHKRAHPHGPPSNDARQSLEALCLTWLRIEVAVNNEISTLESYTSTIANHVSPHIGAIPICELTPLRLQAWVNELAQGTEQMRGKGRTAAYAYSIVRAALNAAVRWGILDKNPALHVTVPAYQKRKGKALTLPQVKALIAAAAGRLDVRKPFKRSNGRRYTPIKVNPRLAVLYLLYIALGTRRGELLALRWSDIDFETGAVTIERSLDKHRRERGTKTEDSDRILYLDGVLIAALLAHRERMRAEGHNEGFAPDGLVFPNEDGGPIHPNNLRQHFRRVLAAAGLPATIRIHDLRHTAASLMLARGNQLLHVSKTLGHSSTVITGDVYGHAYEEEKRKAIASVSEAINQD